MRPPFRHTKIVATLGPATDAPGVLRRLVETGLDVARLNAAHGNESDHVRRIRAVRAIARSLGRPVAILIDLPGPKLRLGELAAPVELRRGARIVLASGARATGALPVRIPRFSRQVRARESIFLSDGNVHLHVERVSNGRVRCRVLVGGTVRSGSGLNLPESKLTMRLPTAHDVGWIRFALREQIDWIGVSFVRTVADLEAVQALLGGSASRPLVMAKIEKRLALDNLEAIVAAADGVMVARGDLGVETRLPEVPVVQKRIIAAANRLGRPVVTATQMLESMIDDPTPTRAEVTDVANAVLDGTDAVMLSAETAIGRYPELAVRTLRDVIAATEPAYPYGAALERRSPAVGTLESVIAAEACRLAAGLGASVIAAPITHLGAATALSRFRPAMPIAALAASEELRRQLAIVWGMAPVRLPTATGRHRLAEVLGPIVGRRVGRIVSVGTSGISDRLDTLRVIDL